MKHFVFYENRLLIAKPQAAHIRRAVPRTPLNNETFPSLQVLRLTFCMTFPCHACYLSHLPFLPWFDHPNKYLLRTQITNAVIMHFSLIFCYFLHVGSKCTSSGPYHLKTSDNDTTWRGMQKFCILPRMHLYVLCGSQNKQRLFPYTTLTDWFLYPRRNVFTARYGLDVYI